MRLLIILLFVGLTCDLLGQGRILTGKIIGSEFRTKKDNAPYEFWNLAGAKIFWKDSLIGTADNKGEFKIELTKKIDQIEIGWIGMYPEKINISDKCEHLEIIMLPDAIYDFVTAKKEERLRQKDRAILPDLYKNAFQQAIFRQEEPCR